MRQCCVLFLVAALVCIQETEAKTKHKHIKKPAIEKNVKSASELIQGKYADASLQNVVAIGESPKPVNVAQQERPTGVTVNKPVADVAASGLTYTPHPSPLGKIGVTYVDTFGSKVPKVKGKPVPVTRQKFPVGQASPYQVAPSVDSSRVAQTGKKWTRYDFISIYNA